MRFKIKISVYDRIMEIDGLAKILFLSITDTQIYKLNANPYINQDFNK